MFEAVSVLDNHTLVCHLEVERGYEATRWDPGVPPSIALVACYLYDADILPLLDERVVARIEEAAGVSFDEEQHGLDYEPGDIDGEV